MTQSYDDYLLSPGAWGGGPCFEVTLTLTKVECPLDRVNQAFSVLPNANRLPLVDSLPRRDRWVISHPNWAFPVGFLLGASSKTVWLATYPGQLARVCNLSPRWWLSQDEPSPNPESSAFILGLTDVVLALAKHVAIDFAVLTAEDWGTPMCPLDSGWVYVSAWAGRNHPIAEATADSYFLRVPLSAAPRCP